MYDTPFVHDVVSIVHLIYICIHSPSDPVAIWNWSATDLVGSVKAMTYKKFSPKTQMSTDRHHTLKEGRKYDKYCVCCQITDFSQNPCLLTMKCLIFSHSEFANTKQTNSGL